MRLWKIEMVPASSLHLGSSTARINFIFFLRMYFSLSPLPSVICTYPGNQIATKVFQLAGGVRKNRVLAYELVHYSCVRMVIVNIMHAKYEVCKSLAFIISSKAISRKCFYILGFWGRSNVLWRDLIPSPWPKTLQTAEVGSGVFIFQRLFNMHWKKRWEAPGQRPTISQSNNNSPSAIVIAKLFHSRIFALWTYACLAVLWRSVFSIFRLLSLVFRSSVSALTHSNYTFFIQL